VREDREDARSSKTTIRNFSGLKLGSHDLAKLDTGNHIRQIIELCVGGEMHLLFTPSTTSHECGGAASSKLFLAL
jgi:hypothetical protein